ncbi:hypothetical protein AURDEDRAFT_154150 [Auricularia subglabra TFB-10046 SS5]|nr:hypothetical protein AURDEDRAFT_154150 [Auricularia subglabra TFB-10046 SS5]
MAQNTYKMFYFKFPGLADISRLMLDAVGADYENVFVENEAWASGLKAEQRFGRVPRLTVKTPDGTVQHIWESRAIQAYIADAFDLVSPGTEALARADVVSTVFSLYEAQDRLALLQAMPTRELRKAVFDLALNDRLPATFTAHEKLVVGPFYYGEKMLFPDLVLYALYLRFEETFGKGRLINERDTPKLWQIVQACEKGRPGAYARERRDWGTRKWDAEELKMVSAV